MTGKRKSPRWKDYDYSRDNIYFITICVKQMICCFGRVVPVVTEGYDSLNAGNDPPDLEGYEMKLNHYGKIAEKQWLWLGKRFSYVKLHAHIIMPNHVHGIIEIDRSLAINNKIKIKSVVELIGVFKTTSSKQIHLAGYNDFKWHRSFYDRIIRNEKSLNNVINYILNNPRNWVMDNNKK